MLLSSLGILVDNVTLLGVDARVDRAIFTCTFVPEAIHPNQRAYWDGEHTIHADLSDAEALRVIQEKSELLYRKRKT